MGMIWSGEERAVLLARLERRTDRPLTALALVLIPLLLAPYLFDLSPEAEDWLLRLDYVIWGAFVADLVAKLIVAPRRLDYLRRHWIDVLLVVVPVLRPFRAVRALRLLWVIGAAGRAFEGSRRVLERRGLGYILIGLGVIAFVAAGLITAVESDAPDATIQSFGDGLWWAMATITTVGYGDVFPVTAAGRAVAVVLMMLGIAGFGLVTASLAAYFVAEDEDANDRRWQEIDGRLRRIEEAIARPRDEGE